MDEPVLLCVCQTVSDDNRVFRREKKKVPSRRAAVFNHPPERRDVPPPREARVRACSSATPRRESSARATPDAAAMQCLSSPNMVRAPVNRLERSRISPRKRPLTDSPPPVPTPRERPVVPPRLHRGAPRRPIRRRWVFPTTSCIAGSGRTGACTVVTGTSSRTSARCTISSPRGGSTRSSPSAPAETGT